MVGKVQSLKTRISPHQLYKLVNQLSDVQRDAVKQMGFGKMLNIKTDAIPYRLAHYVLDNFDPSSMEIKVNAGRIKVDENEISNLFGIKNDGVLGKSDDDGQDMKVSEKTKWENVYSGGKITPSRVAARVETNKEDNGWVFKYDFLTIMMNSFVSIHMDGRCNSEHLNQLGEDTKIEDINWCAYICNKLRNCKVGWQRNCDKLFNGPIPVLVLLYVDMTTCGGMNIERTMSPLEYWTKDLLSRRENYEISNGGFGWANVRESYKEPARKEDEVIVTEGTKRDGKKVVAAGIEDGSGSQGGDANVTHVGKLEGIVVALKEQKEIIKEELIAQQALNPDDEHLLDVIRMYNELFKDEVKASKVNTNVDEIVDDIIKGLNEESEPEGGRKKKKKKRSMLTTQFHRSICCRIVLKRRTPKRMMINMKWFRLTSH